MAFPVQPAIGAADRQATPGDGNSRANAIGMVGSTEQDAHPERVRPVLASAAVVGAAGVEGGVLLLEAGAAAAAAVPVAGWIFLGIVVVAGVSYYAYRRSQENAQVQADANVQVRGRCQPVPVPNRGGDPIHDACAANVPGNLYPNNDVLVNGKNFDAFDGSSLWEVKTDNYSAYPPFLQQRTIQNHVRNGLADAERARQCGYGYVFGVADPQQYSALLATPLAPYVRFMPQCSRATS